MLYFSLGPTLYPWHLSFHQLLPPEDLPVLTALYLDQDRKQLCLFLEEGVVLFFLKKYSTKIPDSISKYSISRSLVKLSKEKEILLEVDTNRGASFNLPDILLYYNTIEEAIPNGTQIHVFIFKKLFQQYFTMNKKLAGLSCRALPNMCKTEGSILSIFKREKKQLSKSVSIPKITSCTKPGPQKP